MKTLQDYDALPYSDCPITESRPDNLYVIGRLFGLNPSLPDNCKVLEIGCAGGGNLIPLAYYWPNSEFVGVELSEAQASLASQIIAELELKNIHVLHQDLLTLDADFGQFDYIIAHGVYSWVPQQVQDHLLNLCSALLKPNGIAYLSYNTLPGWEQRNMLRDMMLYHSRSAQTPQQQLKKSLEFLRLLHQGLPENGSMSEQWLKQQTAQLLKSPPNYIYHDYLEKYNKPVYFHQFAQHAAQHSLQYFSEASIYTMLSSSLTPEAEEVLDQLDDAIEYEQYMDFFYIKHFRQSLLCNINLAPQRTIEVEVLKDCYFYSTLFCEQEIDLHSPSPQTFTSALGDSYDVTHPLVKAALVELALAYPSSLPFYDIVQRANAVLIKHGDRNYADDTDVLFEELVNLYLSGAFSVSTTQTFVSTDIHKKPRFNDLTKVFAKHNKVAAATMHHNSITLNNIQRKLIKLADGSHTVEELTEMLSRDTRVQADFRQMQAESSQQKLFSDFIEQTLYYFASIGLVT